MDWEYIFGINFLKSHHILFLKGMYHINTFLSTSGLSWAAVAHKIHTNVIKSSTTLKLNATRLRPTTHHAMHCYIRQPPQPLPHLSSSLLDDGWLGVKKVMIFSVLALCFHLCTIKLHCAHTAFIRNTARRFLTTLDPPIFEYLCFYYICYCSWALFLFCLCGAVVNEINPQTKRRHHRMCVRMHWCVCVK